MSAWQWASVPLWIGGVVSMTVIVIGLPWCMYDDHKIEALKRRRDEQVKTMFGFLFWTVVAAAFLFAAAWASS